MTFYRWIFAILTFVLETTCFVKASWMSVSCLAWLAWQSDKEKYWWESKWFVVFLREFRILSKGLLRFIGQWYLPMEPWKVGFCFSPTAIGFGVQKPYCWWLKSQTTTWDVWNPINNGINYLSTGAGFQPSTVVKVSGQHSLRGLSDWFSGADPSWAAKRFRGRFDQGSAEGSAKVSPKFHQGCTKVSPRFHAAFGGA